MGIWVKRTTPMRAQAESLTQRGPRNEYEKKLLESLSLAKQHVEKLYGIEIKKMPHLLVSKKQVIPDKASITRFRLKLMRKGIISSDDYRELKGLYYPENSLSAKLKSKAWAASEELSFLLMFPSYGTPRYIPALNAISMPQEAILDRLTKGTGLSLQGILDHELVHHAVAEAGSPIWGRQPSLFAIRFHLACANEGLAQYIEEHSRKPTTPLEKIKELTSKLISHLTEKQSDQAAMETPIQKAISCLSQLIARAAKAAGELSSRFLRRIKSSRWDPVSLMAADAYADGLEFVRQVAGHLGTAAEAFSLITQHPPQSMGEVIFPETYFARLDREIGKTD